jgi:hypothetical protein
VFVFVRRKQSREKGMDCFFVRTKKDGCEKESQLDGLPIYVP